MSNNLININSNKIKISVIIPIYNVEDFIHKSLDSVINQTLKDIEIICIDDCSTDNSLDILKQYAQRDCRFKIIKQEENQGQGVARNVGLEVARGEYIMFLDPDDWFELSACEKAYNQIKKNHNDIVFFNYFDYFEYTYTITMKKSRHLEMFKNHLDANESLEDLENLSFKAATVWAQIYDSNFVRRINAKFANNRNCEDNPFYFTCIANAKSVSVINEELYFYRKRTNSSSPYYAKNWQDVIENKNLSYEIIKKAKSEALLKAFIPFYWKSCLWHCYSAIKNNKECKELVYKNLHEIAMKLNKEYPMEDIQDKINWQSYRKFSYSDKVIVHKLLGFLYRIYSTERTSVRKKMYILGLKISKKYK